ncbi:MAG: SRPBCC domain-containing protein [Flavobacteriia bacterium]|nr:SRPBCC domain-containing protein [Flavobacteriia bacterium]
MHFTLKARFQTSASSLYNAWLSSSEHTKMTGGKAVIGTKVGDKFSAWDGYITGINLELKPFLKIVQSWRSTDFSPKDEDSLLELEFEEEAGRTTLTLKHSNLSKEGERYIKGWEENYFEPMALYFGR